MFIATLVLIGLGALIISALQLACRSTWTWFTKPQYPDEYRAEYERLAKEHEARPYFR